MSPLGFNVGVGPGIIVPSLEGQDIQCNSVSADAGLSGQAATVTDAFTASDPVSGNAAELDPNDGLTMNGAVLSPSDLGVVVQRTIIKAATGNLSASDVTNTLISNYGQSADATHTLPTAGPNMGFVATIATIGHAVHYKAGPNDKIYLDGTALDDGDKVSCSTPAIGNAVAFFTQPTGDGVYDWYCNPLSGSWVDGGA